MTRYGTGSAHRTGEVWRFQRGPPAPCKRLLSWGADALPRSSTALPLVFWSGHNSEPTASLQAGLCSPQAAGWLRQVFLVQPKHSPPTLHPLCSSSVLLTETQLLNPSSIPTLKQHYMQGGRGPGWLPSLCHGPRGSGG